MGTRVCTAIFEGGSMGEGGKVATVVSSAKRRVGMEAPLAADDDSRTGIVRGALRAFGEGDMDAFVDALKDDVEWESPSGDNFPGAGDHSGPDEIRDTYIADVGRTYASFGFRPDSFIETDHEDAVVVIGTFVGEAADAAGELETPGVQIWGFTGKSVAHIRIFADSAAFPEVVTEEALREQEEKAEEKEKESEEKESSEEKSETKSEKKSEEKSSEEKSEQESDENSEKHDDSDDA
jgi:ketosteroid isomerase-like protein